MRSVARITLFTLMAVSGCRDATAPIDGFHAAPLDILSPLALTTSVSPAVLSLGGTVTMTLKITNVSRETLTVHTTACPSRVVISTRDGVAVDRGRPICTLELGVKTLVPGESVSLTETWDGMELVGGDAVARVPAGKYFIQGSDFNGRVRSNPPAQLTVLE